MRRRSSNNGGLLGITLLMACSLSACASALKPLDSSGLNAERSSQDPANIYADIRAILRDIQNQPSAERRETMSGEAVRLGQRCEQIAPKHPLCDYGLALALGVQARERPSTAHDGLKLMEEHLQRAASNDPDLDHAGPDRVLGLMLVHAPGWPTGPGDPEAGLEAARRAIKREPTYAPNWLAVAEAAQATGDAEIRRQSAKRAAELAKVASRAEEPEADDWERDAQKLLK